MKNTLSRYTLIISILIIYVLRFVTFERVSIKNGELIFLLLVAVILLCSYFIMKNRYSNMSTFFILTFMLIGLLPYCHYLNYSTDKKNYSFNTEYIKHNINNYKENLKNYKDSIFFLELKSILEKTNRNVEINNSLLGKKQTVKDFTFILKKNEEKWFLISGTPHTPSYRSRAIIDIYKNKLKIKRLELEYDNLKDEIEFFTKEKDLLNAKIKNPKKFIPFTDIWLDSVTGFVFSFIKPLSQISQIIRLIQLITAYLFFHMISSWLKISKKINIQEKTTQH